MEFNLLFGVLAERILNFKACCLPSPGLGEPEEI